MRPVVLILVALLATQPAVGQQPAATPTPSATAPTEQPTTTQPSYAPIVPPAKAQAFQFTDVDLELLRQIDAFDKYMEEHGWVYDDPANVAYVEKVGRKLVPDENLDHVTWRFRILRDPEVNAFALPNGSIYVNSGLLSRMENEAQVAGVLAHEISHVTNRHTYLEYRSIRKKSVAIHVVMAGLSAAYYAGANPYVINALGTMVPLVVISTVFGYSRELEHESDVYAVKILNNSGYDLREFARGFELLKKGPEVDLSKEPVFWASHPKLNDRVKYVNAMAAQLQPDPHGLRVDPEDYLAGTRVAIRNNANLDIMLGRPRTAVAVAQRLIAQEPSNADYHALLGDAYRALGARTVVPTEEELTDYGKDEARKNMRKMTLREYDAMLMRQPLALDHWKTNGHAAEEAYRKALALDPTNASAYRGLGFLYEKLDRREEAVVSLDRYLELAPNAKDVRQVRLHLEQLRRERLPKASSAR